MAKIHIFSNYAGPVITEFHVKRSWHGQYLSYCKHCQFVIHEAERKIICKECGEEIDPFTVVLEYANHQRDFIWKVERHKAAIEEFKKIQQEWSLTVREKRRIEKAMRDTRCPMTNFTQE